MLRIELITKRTYSQNTRDSQKNSVAVCTVVSSWSMHALKACENVDMHRLKSHIKLNARSLCWLISKLDEISSRHEDQKSCYCLSKQFDDYIGRDHDNSWIRLRSSLADFEKCSFRCEARNYLLVDDTEELREREEQRRWCLICLECQDECRKRKDRCRESRKSEV